ncbi:hypothetical protein ACVB8X_32715 [Streptomyces sp. NRAIS4]
MRRLITATVAALAAVLLSVGTASGAGHGKQHDLTADVPAGPTKKCVTTAQQRDLASWACMGSTLLANGKAEQLDKSAAKPAVTAKAATDDDEDSWCEPTGLCTRLISDYIRETKANIWYGYGDQTVGSYDAILRNNLNGRQPRLTTTLILDEGPPLYFPTVTTQCYEEISFWPDNPCGTDTMGGAYLNGPMARWDGGQRYGDRLDNSNEYYHALDASWVPTGYAPLSGRLFETPYFNCYGSDPCYFPSE